MNSAEINKELERLASEEISHQGLIRKGGKGMKTKLLKKLRAEARSRVTIYSVTTEESWRGKYVTGMSIGYSKPQYAHIFSFGMTEEDVKKKAEKIFFETEMGWVRKVYKKYTRRYKHGN